jgi:ribosomal protein S18 acetylase RimI-like enzyme
VITGQSPTSDTITKREDVQLRRQQYGREGFTWSAPDTSDYAVCALWRHRPEIGHIQHFSIGKHTSLLLEQTVADFQQAGVRLVVANQHEDRAGHQALANHGFVPIEELTHYERPLGSHIRYSLQSPSLSICRYEKDDQETILAIEQDAFPWLWWSNAEDLNWYLRLDGVRVWTVRLIPTGVAIGVLGITSRSNYGHIDRLAISQAYQGHGYGRELLEYALAWLQDRGIRRVTLTTQCANHRSQGLYQSGGFIETPGRQQLVGRILDPAVAPLLEAGRAL